MKSVIVTGSNGGIGTAICSYLKEVGYRVVGIDMGRDINNLDAYIPFDLSNLALSKQDEVLALSLQEALGNSELLGLVNNAAFQACGNLGDIDVESFTKSLNVNVVAPFVLSKICFDMLKKSKGSIVNIGSIHSRLTKPSFVAYATSKAALLGLTQSLAVDCGHSIRVNAVQPAAIATKMLLDGFKNNPSAFDKLQEFHPTNTIGKPYDVAKAVAFLLSQENEFLNGCILDINGGIGSRLHDPS
ncbi:MULTISPECIES: SDR family NAD(P)-dependent oxidoreductase [Gammaproteobacteria]|uniref:SDR family NAD(P)-dependent oxidoreductase n=1 Tax=Gammaproteobacteria TaxID=1236 RepID=UPI003A908160